MSFPDRSSQASISRFFKNEKKRIVVNQEAESSNKSIKLAQTNSIGTKQNPLVLKDEEDIMVCGRVDLENEPLDQALSSNADQADVTETDHHETPPGNAEGDHCPSHISPSCESENPFATFAFRESSSMNQRLHLTQRFKSSTSKTEDLKSTKRKSSHVKGTEWVRMRSLSEKEQQRITKKWHSLADASAPLEVRRFQVLVAARLHARCQEPSVRKAMKKLGETFQEFTVEEISKADPSVLAQSVTNLQFYNSKAKQIVKAAQEIRTQFSGIVPEDEHSLLKITGVGKVFADLLAFVNTRAAHTKAVMT